VRVSVIVPTLRRPGPLGRCLDALDRQHLPPDEVLVVHRRDDPGTAAALAEREGAGFRLEAVEVDAPGAVAALNAGIARARAEIVAITDDDTVPHEDWLLRIERQFANDASVGGVGGRDVLEGVPADGDATVGRLRLIRGFDGNHHVGAGPARDVDVLKGANMAFRADAIRGLRFDERLLGSGAQVHWELDFGMAVKRRGWRLVYDPAVLVDHFPARRFDEDARERRAPLAVRNEAHNEAYVLLRWLPWPRRVGYLVYALAIGSRRLSIPWSDCRAASAGRVLAVRTIMRSRRHGG
jgi:cellulose synthase/poly-beta-1,6-N-acetylglucosamine synthase-like glycosyltransferase